MQFLFIMRLSLFARFSVITGLIGLYSIHASAQQMKLGDNPSVLKKDAILELNSANQGLLLPRVLKSQISTGGKLFAAEDGMFVFVSDEKTLYVKRFGIWQKVGDVSATSITGDVDVTGSGALTTTINPKAVTYAKMQDVTTSSLLGRYSATNGTTQEIKLGSNLSFNTSTGVLNAAGVTSLTGDVTAPVTTGAAAATITAKAVTYAKIQDVTSQSLLGRYGAGNGVTQEVKIGSNMTLDATTGMLTANAGSALWNASKLQGRDVVTTAPSNGDVLKYNSTTSAWEPSAASGGGITSINGAILANGTGAVTAYISDGAVAYSKIQAMPGQTILGRYATTLGVTQEITIGSNMTLNSTTGVLSANAGSALWNASQLQGRTIGTTTPSSGNVLKWNGTSWDAAADAGGITALTSDVTASGTGSVAATIAAKAVTYAKMQDVTASSLLGRYNAANGTVQEIKIGGTLSFNTTTGTLSAAGISGLTGDVTASGTSGSVAATIAAKAVTFAKFQDLSTQTLVGRYSTGTGVAQEVKITGGNLLLNNSTGILSADNASAVWNANKLLSRNIATTTPGNGEVLKYNTTTSAWEPSADLNGGATYGTLGSNDIAQADAPDNFSRMKIWASPVTGTVTNGPLGTGAYSWNVLSFRGGGYTTQLYFDKSTLAVKEWGGNNATLTTNAGNPWYKMVMTHGDANIDNGAIVFGGKTYDASTEVKSDAGNLYFDNNNKRLGVGTNAPASTIQSNGSLAAGVYISTNGNNVNADASMFTIVVRRTNGTANVTVTLPAANTCTGRIYYVVRDYSGANGSVTITGASSEVSSKVIWNNPEIYCVQSIGTKWIYLTYGPAW